MGLVPDPVVPGQHPEQATIGGKHAVHEPFGEEFVHGIPVELKAIVHLADLMVDPDLRRLRDVVDHAPERAQGRMGAVLVAEADGTGEDDGDDVGAGTARASAPFADDLHAGEGAVIHVGPQPGLQGPCAPEEG